MIGVLLNLLGVEIKKSYTQKRKKKMFEININLRTNLFFMRK